MMPSFWCVHLITSRVSHRMHGNTVKSSVLAFRLNGNDYQDFGEELDPSGLICFAPNAQYVLKCILEF